MVTLFSFSACGKKDEIAEFKKEIDAFCTDISTIDTTINSIDAQSDQAVTELLQNLDALEADFNQFAELDFPQEYDYLEPLADEASSYMSEAVASYHTVYQDEDSYSENTADYAKENYGRAYKRIQIIIAFLHGEDPAEMGLVITEE